jgi:hypothetical protein
VVALTLLVLRLGTGNGDHPMRTRPAGLTERRVEGIDAHPRAGAHRHITRICHVDSRTTTAAVSAAYEAKTRVLRPVAEPPLQKAGFAITGTEISFANRRKTEIEVTIPRLDEPVRYRATGCVERRRDRQLGDGRQARVRGDLPQLRAGGRVVREDRTVGRWRGDAQAAPLRRAGVDDRTTTEGVVREPSALAMTVGSPPSRTATTELAVPRSMPTARAICCLRVVCTCGRRPLVSPGGELRGVPGQCAD